MSKRYTAEDMRKMANREKLKCSFVTRTLNGGIILDCTSDVRAMLLQAADMMEREKMYEYTAEYVKRRSGKVDCKCVYHFNSFDEAKRFKHYPLKGEKLRFIRRVVGEWEEVSDDRM